MKPNAKYFLQKHSFKGSGDNSTGGYSLRIKSSGKVSFDALIQRVVEVTGRTTKGDVEQVMDALLKLLSDDLATGRIVDFGPLSLNLGIQGGVDNINSGYDSALHTLKINVRVNRKFRDDLLRNVTLERVEANDTSPLLRSVTNTSKNLENQLMPHDLVQVRGKNLKIGNSEEEGIFLLNLTDNLSFKVQDVGMNSANTLIFKTPDSVTKGVYKILVKSKITGKLKEGSLEEQIEVAA
ncbi:MAG TPA: DUF4469 domain-containing protein [Leptospiraceae bacterium]|jgi:hypothetical protein|nr:DUF4469 domain-containing protein [Leptospiraceae bacterium]HRG73924.1 DUF4469 domain-containing protein [Leptospiraceae bacterium]